MLIDPDIKKASTLPSQYYTSIEIFEKSKTFIFKPSWQFIGDTDLLIEPGQIHPFTLLDGYLNEPLLLTRDLDSKLHLLSNVCTHRGNILAECPGTEKTLRCRYHGRRFSLDGKFLSMPECEDAINFPTETDNLSKVQFRLWDKFIFASIDPGAPCEEFIGDMLKRLEGMPKAVYVFDSARSRDYEVKANWALYVDNYLEGFHIPYVHNSLNEKLDYGEYSGELYKYSNLQIGVAKRGESCFQLHETSPDFGKEIAAYYWWIFPNMMFNFYPWGLSINVIKPIDEDLTRISYLAYVSDPSKLDTGAGAGLDKVEMEDEAIVEQVQKGMSSSFYSRGRYSPLREQGVHHFHSLLYRFLNNTSPK